MCTGDTLHSGPLNVLSHGGAEHRHVYILWLLIHAIPACKPRMFTRIRVKDAAEVESLQ